jgi:hypothetical protein
MDVQKLRSGAAEHNGRFVKLDGNVAVFVWDDEDDSDAFNETLENVVRVTHDHEKGYLTSRVTFKG